MLTEFLFINIITLQCIIKLANVLLNGSLNGKKDWPKIELLLIFN